MGCTRTNSTTKSRMSATELAVDATIDRAGIPSGELGSLSEGTRRRRGREKVKMWFTDVNLHFLHEAVRGHKEVIREGES